MSKCLPFLLPLLALAQDSETWVDRLGSDDPMVRAEAEKKLIELGDKARAGLTQASRSTDADIRTRALRLLERIEQDTQHRELVVKQRSKKLHLVTLSTTDTLENILSQLSQQTGVSFKPNKLDLSSKASLDVKTLPLIQVLDQLGLGIDSKGRLSQMVPPPITVYTDGARFTFERMAWEPKGERQGWIFKTTLKEEPGTVFRWGVVSIQSDGKEQPLETCDLHSPQLVYVPQPKLSDAIVTIKGTRTWWGDVAIEMDTPKNGATRRVGTFQIELKWPKVIVHSDTLMEDRQLRSTLFNNDIKFKIKPGHGKQSERNKRGVYDALGVGGGPGGGLIKPKDSWCGCLGGPRTGSPARPTTNQELAVLIYGAEEYAIDDIEKISIQFHKPIEELFHLSSPVLK